LNENLALAKSCCHIGTEKEYQMEYRIRKAYSKGSCYFYLDVDYDNLFM